MREAARTGGSRFDPGRLAHALWHGRTLRAPLLILFVLIELVAAAVAGAVTIFNARTATRVEIAASMELAELWVIPTAPGSPQILPELESQPVDEEPASSVGLRNLGGSLQVRRRLLEIVNLLLGERTEQRRILC